MRSCPPIYRTARLMGVEITWGSRGDFAVRNCQSAIESGGSGYSHAVRSTGRPAHTPFLAHSRIGNIVNTAFST
jgi:hypothetical protein